MKKFLNNLLTSISGPLNGNKLNLGLVLGALNQLAPQALSFLPPHWAAVGSAGLILIGALHKAVKQ